MAAGTYQEYLFGRWTAEFGQDGVKKLLDDGHVAVRTQSARVSLNRDRFKSHVDSIALSETGVSPTLLVTPSIRFFDGRTAGACCA